MLNPEPAKERPSAASSGFLSFAMFMMSPITEPSDTGPGPGAGSGPALGSGSGSVWLGTTATGVEAPVLDGVGPPCSKNAFTAASIFHADASSIVRAAPTSAPVMPTNMAIWSCCASVRACSCAAESGAMLIASAAASSSSSVCGAPVPTSGWTKLRSSVVPSSLLMLIDFTFSASSFFASIFASSPSILKASPRGSSC